MPQSFSEHSQQILKTLLQKHQRDIKAAIVEAVEKFYAGATEHPELKIILERLGEERIGNLKKEQAEHSWLLLQPDDGELLEQQHGFI